MLLLVATARPRDYQPLPGGDTCLTATLLPEQLPIAVTGTTVGYANNYDEICPYPGSVAPDVVYAYAPPEGVNVRISLCRGPTDFDTKLYVYKNVCPDPGGFWACNDDACVSSLPHDYVSELTDLTLAAGNTYYIVIDGYGSEAGTYYLDIDPSEQPAVQCPDGSLFAQPTALPGEAWAALASDEATGFAAYEDFWAVDQPICNIRWWAFNRVNIGGNWQECTRDPDRYNIRFHPDDGSGKPDRSITLCEYLGVTPAKTYTGLKLDGRKLYYYSVELHTYCVLNSGWVAIEGVNDGQNCWHLWVSSLTGDEHCWQWNGSSLLEQNYNLSLCLSSSAELGACCIDGQCAATNYAQQCAAMGGSWYPGEDCFGQPPFECPFIPQNDECAAATAVQTGVPEVGKTVNATGGDISSCGGGDSKDVWLKWVSTCEGLATFTTCGPATDFDTTLAVYADCGGAGSELDCNDDDADCGFGADPSTITLPVKLGTSYYIRIAGTGGATGTYDFVVTVEHGPGDLNCDCNIDGWDIQPFVLALTDPAGYAQQYPNCDRMLADCNGDGGVDGFDIQAFVDLLVGK